MSNKVAPVPLYEVFRQFKTEAFKDLRVCLPGSISGVDISTGTVSVKLGVMQHISQQYLPAGLDFYYPELTSCPVFTVQGGGVGAVMPIEIGDQCLVVFSDRCNDAWFTTGEANPLPSTRMHDISDGFVLVGLNPLAPDGTSSLKTSLLADGSEGGICETEASAPQNGAKIVLNPTTHKISIANGAAGVNSLLAALTTLITALNTLTVNTGTGLITPASVAAINAAQTALNALLY